MYLDMKVKAKRVFHKAFIIASKFQDLLPLKDLLEKYDITSSDHISIPDNYVNISLAIEEEIINSDLCIGVITKNMNPNIYLEIGIARGARKPIFLIIEGDELTPFLENITYVLASITDINKIEFSLAQFLSNYSIKNKNISKFRNKYDRIESNLQQVCNYKIESEVDIYNEVNCLLKSYNLINKENRFKDQGADMSIWVDGLESIISNPILVEIKYGNLSINKLLDYECRLRDYVKKINGSAGLLIYFDKTGKKFESRELIWPLIIWLDFHDLMSLLPTKSLAEIILEKRNQMMHNKL